MKRHFSRLPVLAMVVSVIGACTAHKVGGSAGKYTIATFNIRYNAPDPGDRNWTVRRPLVTAIVTKYDFDIVGLQEAQGPMLDQLLAALPQFGRIGVGREGYPSEHSAILYKKMRFSVLDSGTFWLAPGAPRTKTGPSWDAALVRCASWAKFRDKTSGREFWLFNAHFDHVGKASRDSSAALVMREMKKMAGSQPAIFTGDLNANPTTSMYRLLDNSGYLRETWNTAGQKSPAARVTFNSWKADTISENQIDHIFTTGHWRVDSRTVIRDTYNGVLPSDHFPVMAKMRLP